MNKAAVILGAYVNAYSVVSELYEEGVKDIIVVSHKLDVCAFSNKVNQFIKSPLNAKYLLKTLLDLNKSYERLVIYSTQDLHLELLLEIKDKVQHFCFIPFNETNVSQCIDKSYQYGVCAEIGVPYPKTVPLRKPEDFGQLSVLMFPIIVKPSTRLDKKIKVFRSLLLQDKEALKQKKNSINLFFSQGVSFIASEVIPGDGSNIHSYMGYRNKKGEILNEWIGKKITQYPDDFGIFSSATNHSAKEVMEQGRALLHGLNLYGINQPEFKYDYRDGKYKLMEINLRSMMWNRVGYLSGVKLHLTQWEDALGEKTTPYLQNTQQHFRYLYFKHELVCLLFRKGYYKTYFKEHFKSTEKIHWATLDKSDWKPFIFDQYKTIKTLIAQCLKALKIISE